MIWKREPDRVQCPRRSGAHWRCSMSLRPSRKKAASCISTGRTESNRRFIFCKFLGYPLKPGHCTPPTPEVGLKPDLDQRAHLRKKLRFHRGRRHKPNIDSAGELRNKGNSASSMVWIIQGNCAHSFVGTIASDIEN